MVCRTRSVYPAVALLIALLGTTAALASLSVYMSPEDLARRAELIVEGRVVRTASGYDPLRGSLATYVTLKIETLHRGELEAEYLTLREPGGRYGDLAHDVDAVPVYTPGETVLVFLEPAADGALRTAGMFFGKYRLEADGDRAGRTALRDLEGNGLILGRASRQAERLPVGDLIAVVANTPREAHSAAGEGDRGRRRAARAAPVHADPRTRVRGRFSLEPPELSRLRWDQIRVDPVHFPAREETATDGSSALAERPGPTVHDTKFAPMSETHPTRWYQVDAGFAVTVQIERAGNPLGDGAAAVVQMQRALEAWTDVPESRLALQVGDDDYDYTGSASGSPAEIYSGTNVILFGDPYEDISDPSGCSGVLAIGGYWRTSFTYGAVNNVAFHRAKQLYVIFNDNFECFLGDPDNLAEVAAHELGHGLGFGHSAAYDAIMRSSAHGDRGPRLGDDDRDGAHCHYPHTLQILSPNGGESWEAGSYRTIVWSVTTEDGPQAGEVDLEYSANDGLDWIPIRRGVENDGAHDWLVPNHPGSDVKVRVVRHHRAGAVPLPYPEACSHDASDGSFSITPPVIVAGSIPCASSGSGLAVALEPGGELRLSWSPSCSADADDYAIYEGSISALRSGTWDHLPRICSAGPDLAEYLIPQGGSRYYLVAPLAGGKEGTYGTDAEGQLRPQPELICAPRESVSTCR